MWINVMLFVGISQQISITMGPFQQLGNVEKEIYTVYTNNTLNENFDISISETYNCAPIQLQYFKTKEIDTYTPINIFNSNSQPLALQDVKLKCLDGQMINTQIEYDKYSLIGVNSTKIVSIIYKCDVKITKDNYWAIIEVSLIFDRYQPFVFHYQFICDPDFHPTRFDISYILLLITMSITVFVLSRYQKLKAFKFRIIIKNQESNIFQGIYIGLIASIIYTTLFISAIILAIIFKQAAEEFEETVALCICGFFSYIFWSEIYYKFKRLRKKLIKKFRLCDLLSIITTILIIYLYSQFAKNWILSDLISIVILGAAIKLFKIISLKDAIKFYTLCIVVDILISLYAVFYIRTEWDSVLIKYFNTPLTIQIPYFHQIYKKKCGWISIAAILFPSFFLAYSHRFDREKDTLYYRIISFLGLILGLILWFILSSIYYIPLPVSVFTLVPMVGMSALIAFQRNEFKSFWNGHFYDQVLLNPFRHTLNSQRSSIQSIKLGKTEEVQEQPQNQIEMKTISYLVRQEGSKVQLKDDLFDKLLC